MVSMLRWFLVGAGCLLPTVALADPCEAPLPQRAGQQFGGVVRYVGDGDSLCVGSSSDPSTWVEVRLADFDAPELNAAGGREARAALVRIALNRGAICVAQRGRSGRVTSYDRVIAVCRIGDRPIGHMLRRAGVREGGN